MLQLTIEVSIIDACATQKRPYEQWYSNVNKDKVSSSMRLKVGAMHVQDKGMALTTISIK